ncbi:hypothetical protein GLOIN_2v1703888 [Rhizophagus irregularis DAOM 181602=DAOM 197198]|uniref:Uncharacterized protein n=1 Tax=Rhizophagus irregularis (strain DAOM 181602 / DAOM 197198 / MUCL 43194) TaxID=747089 RepID=A0A2P4P7X3_RHIID|nr:hypothetical protein GLOIN_2v1703888 [Rhizophagus irregularis DAOM 181602=DAOM 197198]POG61491.1 hypothetical protein GLOIN_2v1703888 [Rhizophagus irregularis DAOM 181602=DAOM 197198]|eukprot:XP_025168357.1 hypothetical protein GLOIN_2v1703888 [Rhizophagus irregularis DAOM 181602=DAOM 197198]
MLVTFIARMSMTIIYIQEALNMKTMLKMIIVHNISTIRKSIIIIIIMMAVEYIPILGMDIVMIHIIPISNLQVLLAVHMMIQGIQILIIYHRILMLVIKILIPLLLTIQKLVITLLTFLPR